MGLRASENPINPTGGTQTALAVSQQGRFFENIYIYIFLLSGPEEVYTTQLTM